MYAGLVSSLQVHMGYRVGRDLRQGGETCSFTHLIPAVDTRAATPHLSFQDLQGLLSVERDPLHRQGLSPGRR